MFHRVRQLVLGPADRQRRALRGQSGQSLIILAFAFLGLIAMLGLALDLGLVYIERVRIKRAVDAATLAGVVELPFEEDAFSRAAEYLNLNGYNIDPLTGDANVLVQGCVRDFDDWDGDGDTDEYVDHPTPYTYTLVANPRARFILAATSPGAPRTSDICDGATTFGNANRLAITGTVTVDMNFMQFFGFPEVPVTDAAEAQNVTDLDVVVVFDTSGSMEFGTVCYDCWVRTDSNNPDYPNNGYYNPIPATVPSSLLCSATQVPYTEGGYHYLIAEAELAAFNPPLWQTRYRQTGQGYWAIQRGSRSTDFANRAGDPSQQSSNVCIPGTPGTPGADLDCSALLPCTQADCSAYISHHPFATYGQEAPPAELLGMFYYLEDVTDNDPPPPKLEYDFTPTLDWSGDDAHIWLRAQGGGDRAYEPIYQDPFLHNKSTIHWDASSDGFNPLSNTAALGNNRWRDNRADPGEWRWIHLGTAPVTPGEPFVLRLWAGSPGYDIDKIVVTDNPSTNWSNIPALSYDTPANNVGRPATPGSATRAACDPCNPIYGSTVTPDQCTGFSPVLTPTNHLADPLFGSLEPIRTSQEAVKRFIQRLDPEFDQAAFVPFTHFIVRAGQSQLECLKRDGNQCYEAVGPTGPISYTRVLAKLENNTALEGTDIAWGMLEGLKALGVNVLKEPICTGARNPFDNNCFDNDCTNPERKDSCGRGGAAARVMVVLTDGSPNSNPEDEKRFPEPGGCSNHPVYNYPDSLDPLDDPDFDCVIYFAGQAFGAGVRVYTIGLGDGANADLLKMAAETSFGQYYFAPTPADLDAIFDQILGNIYVRLIR